MFCQIMFGDPGRSIGRHGESYPLYGLRSTSLLRPKLVVVQHRRCLLAVNHPWRSPSVPYPYSSSPPSVLHPSRLMRLLITLGLGQRISEILQSGANFDRDRVDMSSDNGLHLRWYCSNRFAPDQHSSSLQLCLIQSLFRHTNYVCELDEQLRKIHSIPILQWEPSDVNPSLDRETVVKNILIARPFVDCETCRVILTWNRRSADDMVQASSRRKTQKEAVPPWHHLPVERGEGGRYCS